MAITHPHAYKSHLLLDGITYLFAKKKKKPLGMEGLMFWDNYKLGNYILLSYISQVILSVFPA